MNTTRTQQFYGYSDGTGYIKTKKSGGYAFFLSILPLIMMYKCPGLNVGCSTALIAVGMVYAGICIIKNARNAVGFAVLVPLLLHFGYVITKSTGENILLCISIFVHLTAIAFGAIDEEKLKKYIIFFSALGAGLVTLQVLVHALTGVHIQCIRWKWCLKSMSSYAYSILTGISDENTYRPSSIFLEPAHLTQYCIIGLILCLFGNRPKRKEAVLITVGVLCSTSGMGIVLLVCCWSWWYLRRNKMLTLQQRIKHLGLAAFIVLLVYLAAINVPILRDSIARITGNSSSGYNAIDGRLFWWDTYFGKLGWRDLIYGFGTGALPDDYFTGFMKELYAYGIIGFSLFIIVILSMFPKSGEIGRLILIMYTGLLFFANLTGFISIIFNFGVVIALMRTKARKRKMLRYS